MDAFRSGRRVGRAALGVFWIATHAAAQATTERVSVDSSGAEGDLDSFMTSISADGQIVAFASDATNLVAGDSNHAFDVFVRDRSTGVTERISVDSSGAQGNGSSYAPSLSADGLIVAFYSDATNLVANDTNGTGDIFVHDRTTGVTERVNLRSGGGQANAQSFMPSLSADGQVVAFESVASNLVNSDTNGTYDVFVHERTTARTFRVSVDSSGNEGNSASHQTAISADGSIVAFYSYATNLVAGDNNAAYDVFVRDRNAKTTELVSVDSSGAQGNDGSDSPSLSADGQVVAFASRASNLVAGDTNAAIDVFIHDRSSGLTERISVDSSGAQGNDDSFTPTISADGRTVAFSSDASNLVATDSNADTDVFVRDPVAGTTERMSVDSSGVAGDDDSDAQSVSADGQIVIFASTATNLVPNDQNGASDVFVHTRSQIDATWSNYGVGFPGTNGVPSFTSQNDPVLGTQLTLDLGNSHGDWTVGVLFVGVQQASLPTSWGGDLLLIPQTATVVGIPPWGASFFSDLPADDTLSGLTIDLQALERDGGAAKGVSFTEGVELLLGH